MREHILAGIAALVILLCAFPYIIAIPSQEYRTPEQLSNNNSLFETVDNIKIHYEMYGDPVNPTVVLIHGFGGSTYTWKQTAPFLQENKYHVIAVDLKGFGLSQKGLDIDYSHYSQAETIVKLMEKLQIKEATIVGHSMGANIAAIITMQHPELVTKLILVDAQLNKPNFNLANTLQLTNVVTIFPIIQYARQIIPRYINQDYFRINLKNAYYNPDLVTDQDIENYSLPIKTKDWVDSLIGIIRDSSKSSLPDSIDKIVKPVRIIWGLQDPWISIEDGKKINVDIKGSIMDVVEESGHLPMEEKPVEFNAILLKDLK